MMKKRLIISLCALASIVAGCAKVDSEPSGENAWILDESLPVPIQFGGAGQIAQTKAAITSLASLEPVYMLGIDVKTTKVSSWSANSANVLLNGATGYFGESAISDGVNAGKWRYVFGTSSAPTKKYYPLEPTFNYNFYGYYIGDQTNSITYSGKTAKVNLDMGFTDVLWAEAKVDTPYTVPAQDSESNACEHAGKTTDGFNARYARWTKEAGVYDQMLPSLQLGHITTRLHVIAKAKNADAYNSFFVNSSPILEINEIRIVGVPTKADLTLADAITDDTSKKGLFTQTENGTISVLTADLPKDATHAKTIPTVDGIELCKTGCEGFYLVPGDLEGAKIEVDFTVNDGSPKQTFTIEDLVESFDPDEDTFQAGKEYTIYVIFNEIMEIEIVAALTPWAAGQNGTPDNSWDPDNQSYE